MVVESLMVIVMVCAIVAAITIACGFAHWAKRDKYKPENPISSDEVNVPVLLDGGMENNTENEVNLPVLLNENKEDAIQDEQEKSIYEDITQIDLKLGEDTIPLRKINIHDIEKYNYREITADRVKGGLSNVFSMGLQSGAISALNPNGLFSATVSPLLLSKFVANGTFSTIIHQGGRIVEHAGFLPISATVFAPIAIMQLLSMVTGQYYMNGITKQLKSIDKKIDKLISLHHKEKEAMLENAQDILKQLAGLQHPAIADVNQLKLIETNIGDIHKEYLKYLEDNKKTVSKINDNRSRFSQKNINKLNSINDNSNFYRNICMVTASDEILHLIPIIEFMLYVKMNTVDNNLNNKIREIYNKIEKYSSKDFFANSFGKEFLNIYYDPLIDEATKITGQAWFRKDRYEKNRKRLEEQKKDIEENIFEKVETLKIKDELVKQMTQPIEIVYSINDNGGIGRVYLKQ